MTASESFLSASADLLVDVMNFGGGLLVPAALAVVLFVTVKYTRKITGAS